MTQGNRRDFLRGSLIATAAATLNTLPPVIQKALAIAPNRRTNSLRDVEHVVILTQENRSFDHYFGTLHGVRGFGDRFPIPVQDSPGITGKTVWYQANGSTTGPSVVAPFRLNTEEQFEVMRVTGTPHALLDASRAWGDGKMSEWPRYKRDHSMGYFTRDDIPFQFAMAEAFTICDAYHCSFMGSTNPNRLFLWTGTNDPLALSGGPAINNAYDNLEHDPAGGYTWVTYAERLQAAGISWQVYQNMADNFTDNSLAGFRTFRDAVAGVPGSLAALRDRGLSTRDLDLLREDVVENRLPQVSWIVATAEGSEHPGPSSPAQGADYTAKVLEALTANPEVWSKTALFVNFDENDGFFDHVPPPVAPSYVSFQPKALAGASTVDTTGEYHEVLPPDVNADGATLLHKPYGVGPRVPMYVLSPWSKGGWVNSEVFDHTSVIRFLERRFGVHEPNITPFRRAVCGDLTSAFNFADPDNADFFGSLPDTMELADLSRALPTTTTPATPALPELPTQDIGTRPSRALPYELHVHAHVRTDAIAIELRFENGGRAGAVFHVYDRKHLDRAPRRYAVESRKRLAGRWDLGEDSGDYDLWVLGPNGFHRHFTGNAMPAGRRREAQPEIEVRYETFDGALRVELRNEGNNPATFEIESNAYFIREQSSVLVLPRRAREVRYPLRRSAYWYDFTVKVESIPGFSRRFAGRVETGRDSFSDPALGGKADGDR